MGHHAFYQLAYIGAQGGQSTDLRGLADGSGQMHQVYALQGEQIALGHHADELIILNHTYVRDMLTGHRNGGIKGRSTRGQIVRRWRHDAAYRIVQIYIDLGDYPAQVTQGENAQGFVRSIDDYNAAHAGIIHGFNRVTDGQFGGATDRAAHGQVAKTGIQRILCTQVFGGLLLRLLIYLIKQAADTAQGKITEARRKTEQLDELRAWQDQAEGILTRDMLGARAAFADQCSQGETFAYADLEGGFRDLLAGKKPLSAHQTLLDDIEMLHRPLLWADDRVALGVKTQLTVLNQIGQMVGLHLVEGRIGQQERHGAMDVLHDRRLACLGENGVFGHGRLVTGGFMGKTLFHVWLLWARAARTPTRRKSSSPRGLRS